MQPFRYRLEIRGHPVVCALIRRLFVRLLSRRPPCCERLSGSSPCAGATTAQFREACDAGPLGKREVADMAVMGERCRHRKEGSTEGPRLLHGVREKPGDRNPGIATCQTPIRGQRQLGSEQARWRRIKPCGRCASPPEIDFRIDAGVGANLSVSSNKTLFPETPALIVLSLPLLLESPSFRLLWLAEWPAANRSGFGHDPVI